MDFEASFLNANIHGQGALCTIGNLGLAPYRYLFGGRDIEIIHAGDKKEIHHVASFHPYADRNKCQTNPELCSSEMNMFHTAMAIAFLLPGLLIGLVFKGIGYCYEDVRDMHGEVLMNVVAAPVNQGLNKAMGNLIKVLQGAPADELDIVEDIVPQHGDMDLSWKSRILNVQTIGSEEPIANDFKLEQAIGQLDPTRPIDVLIIRGNGKFQIKADPGILALNPMKVVLIGARMAPEGKLANAHRLGEADDELDNLRLPQFKTALRLSGKWQFKTSRTVRDALNADNEIRDCLIGKRWHVVHEVQEAPAAKKAGAAAHGKGKPKKPPGHGNIHGVHDRH